MSVKFSDRSDNTTLGVVSPNRYGILPAGVGTSQLANASVTEAKLAFDLPEGGSVWHHGLGAPGSGLGDNGDWYIDVDTGDLYEKASGSWALVYDPLEGGTTWHHGLGIPGSGLGANGDWYIDVDTGSIYEKSGGVWSQIYSVPDPSDTSDTKFPYLAQPASPSAWDLDARVMVSPDLGINGWTIKLLQTPWTTLIRAGDIVAGSGPSSGTYNSTLVGGQLWLQVPAPVTISKTTVNTTSYTYKSRVACSAFGTGNYSLSFVSGGGVELGDAAVNMNYSGIQEGHIIESLWVGATSSAPSDFAVNADTSDMVRYIDCVATAATARMNLLLSHRGLQAFGGNGALSVSKPIDHAGVWVGHASGGIVYLDFIRRTPYLQYP